MGNRRGRGKKAKRWIMTILLLIIVAGLAGGIAYVISKKDQNPPLISFDNEILYLQDEELEEIQEKNYACLLRGIKARDDVDGDVTDKVIVYNIGNALEDICWIIQYRVMDKAGNITRADRLVYSVNQDELYQVLVSTYAEQLGIDEKKAMYMVESAVQNSNSDPEVPVLVIEQEVTLQAGASFNPIDYLVHVSDDKDEALTLLHNAEMQGTVDTHTRGDYMLTLTVKDSDGNVSEPATMVVHVQ